MWHSSAHLLAEALEDIYPGIKLGIGPPIENGFYYDVNLEHRLTEADMQQVTLSGELACSFSQEQGGMPLFIGRGDVVDTAGATGAVKIEDRVRSLQMEGTGGFSGLSDGATLSGDGATVVIDVTGQSPLPEDPQIAEESPRYTASMTVRLDDTSATVEGFYECGP